MTFKMFSCILCVLSIGFVCPTLSARSQTNFSKEEKQFHDAGFGAFNFGPAILTSWKSAVLMEFPTPNGGSIEPTVFPKRTISEPITFKRYVIDSGDDNVDLVRRWLHAHLRNRLNLTPNQPVIGACALRGSYIMLFSSSKPPPAFDLDNDEQPILFRRMEEFKNSEFEKILIIGIPCTDQIFGWDEETAKRDVETLKSLMHFESVRPMAKSNVP